MRNWFIVHLLADVLFSVPLFVAPRAFLGVLGFDLVDPLISRFLAAVLIGVGIGLRCATRPALSRGVEQC